MIPIERSCHQKCSHNVTLRWPIMSQHHFFVSWIMMYRINPLLLGSSTRHDSIFNIDIKSLTSKSSTAFAWSIPIRTSIHGSRRLASALTSTTGQNATEGQFSVLTQSCTLNQTSKGNEQSMSVVCLFQKMKHGLCADCEGTLPPNRMYPDRGCVGNAQQ